MTEIISNINDVMRASSELIYYLKKKDWDKIEFLSLFLLDKLDNVKAEIEKKKIERLNINDTFSSDLFFKLKKLSQGQEADINWRKFQKNIIELKDIIILSFDVALTFYANNNLEILKRKDKKLYDYISDVSLRVSDDRTYDVSWNRIYDISMSVELKDENKINICSSGNPWQEALLYAESVEKNTDKCIVFGFGLGYHIQEIAAMYPDMELFVLENDIEQVRAAVYYRDIKDILENENVHLIYCRDIKAYAKWLKENTTKNDVEKTDCKMWMPSIKTIEDVRLRELLEEYKVSFFSMNYFRDILNDNFDKNQLLKDESVDAIRKNIEGKDVLLIAAGPSFDDEIENLKRLLENKEKRTDICVVCVGKICRKLISQKIIPDYIVMIDANETTRWQISGVEDCGVPLIYLSTTAPNVVSEYKGKRYVAYQNGLEKSEEFAEKNKNTLFDTGGSVATFIIDLAIRFKAKRLICVGLDMGYTGDRTHASGTGVKITAKSRLKKIEAVGGGVAYAAKGLDIYRRWIERRIVTEKDTKFINASHGARIAGMVEKDLCDIYRL